jgi:hypothetical protein
VPEETRSGVNFFFAKKGLFQNPHFSALFLWKMCDFGESYKKKTTPYSDVRLWLFRGLFTIQNG